MDQSRDSPSVGTWPTKYFDRTDFYQNHFGTTVTSTQNVTIFLLFSVTFLDSGNKSFLYSFLLKNPIFKLQFNKMSRSYFSLFGNNQNLRVT